MSDRDFMYILDLVASSCQSVEDFECVISNITTMMENFKEENDTEK